jgi:putative transposase
LFWFVGVFRNTIVPGQKDIRLSRPAHNTTFTGGSRLNYQLRKIIKNRGHFPSDDAVVKLMWLAIRDIEDKRARQRAKETGLPANKRTAPGFLVEGATTNGWKPALNHLELLYPDRLAGHTN